MTKKINIFFITSLIFHTTIITALLLYGVPKNPPQKKANPPKTDQKDQNKLTGRDIIPKSQIFATIKNTDKTPKTKKAGQSSKKEKQKCKSYYGGIGITVSYIGVNNNNPKAVKVTQVYEGYPADKAGIRVGDVIYPIYQRQITGKPDTRVELAVVRKNQRVSMTLVREKICFKKPNMDEYEGIPEAFRLDSNENP